MFQELSLGKGGVKRGVLWGGRSCVQYISFGNCTRCVTGDELEGPVKAANGVEAAARHDISYLQVWLGIDDLHSFFNPHNIQILRKGHARLAFEVAGKVRFRNIHKQGGIVKGNAEKFVVDAVQKQFVTGLRLAADRLR